VSLRGVVPLAPGLDHAGPLARRVADAALLLDAIAGPNLGWSGGRYAAACGGEVAGTRIGVVRQYFLDLVAPDVAARFEEALGTLGSLGCAVTDVAAEVPPDVVDDVFALVGAEAAPFHGPILAEHAADVGPRVLARISLPPPGAAEVTRIHSRLAAVVASLEQALSGVDVLVVPTEPITAPSIGATDGDLAVGGRSVDAEHVLTRLTSIFNVTGFPVVSVPCGFDAAGLPVGLQVVARRGGEEVALRTAHAYEQATEWHLRRPPLGSRG
jgi:aspartyl-tRNA(Asn)/glutamyl-tRNA(Gln) amidotransferase subunit A